MPRLRVLAGPSVEKLQPITELVNTTTPYRFSTPHAEGKLVVNIKGLTDPDGHILTSDYFQREDRKGITWSIQFQGKFLRSHYEDEPVSADDVMFGNIFEHPLKLPWGSAAAFKFMSYIDPNLTHDLASQTKPWALSPYVATMPYLSHTRIAAPTHKDSDNDDAEPTSPPKFPPTTSLVDNTSQLHKTVSEANTTDNSSGEKVPEFQGPTERRAFFSDTANRKKVVFGPQDVITSDFCYGFLEFTPSLSLVIPGGLSFDLMHYWDGQPVRFVCCERKRGGEEGSNADAWGPIFWCVTIELASDEGETVPAETQETLPDNSQDVD